jgi:hypothetical protein
VFEVAGRTDSGEETHVTAAWVETEPGVWERTTAIDAASASEFTTQRLGSLSPYWLDEVSAPDGRAASRG